MSQVPASIGSVEITNLNSVARKKKLDFHCPTLSILLLGRQLGTALVPCDMFYVLYAPFSSNVTMLASFC